MLDPAARGGDPSGQSRLQTPQGTPLGPRLCSHVVFTSFGRPKLKRSKSVGSPGNGGKGFPVTVESMSAVRPPLLSTPAAPLPVAANPVSLILLRCERNPVEALSVTVTLVPLTEPKTMIPASLFWVDVTFVNTLRRAWL